MSCAFLVSLDYAMTASAPPVIEPPPKQIGTGQGRMVGTLSQLPWWLLLLLLAGVILSYKIATDELYLTILGKLAAGIGLTVGVTLVAYSSALLIGLVAGLGRVSKNPVIFNVATLYVQIIRGVPMLVQIFYVAFVLTPAFFGLLRAIGDSAPVSALLGSGNWLAQRTTQDLDLLPRAVIALALAYGGFEAETFRAGIESIGRGQMEAARSLGMSYFQSMRYIILPQAIRRILPPLGNDFIAMLKDSSLVSVLGVRDITQQARLYVSASFRYPETYNMLAFMYLVMTIVLSIVMKWVETRMGEGGKG
jgi:polar amino acid transport system permease protein